MKDKYEIPTATITYFETEDIIAASSYDPDPGLSGDIEFE